MKNKAGKPKRKNLKTWHVLCEGNFEKLYLRRIKELINEQNDAKYNINFDFSKHQKPGGKAVDWLAQSASTITKNPMGGSFPPVVVADVDFRPERLHRAFEEHGKKVTIAYTNVCFELWILLHQQDSCIPHNLIKASGYDESMTGSFLGGKPYDKSEGQYKGIVKNINLSDVWKAIERADQIVTQNADNQKPVLCTYANDTKVYDSNPDLNIHIFLRNVLIEAGLATIQS